MNVSDHKGVQALVAELGIQVTKKRFGSRYNVAPGMEVFGVFSSPVPESGRMQWGIVPPWAKPEQFTRPLINARAETIWEKPSFRASIRSRRAIIPANGFYEWKRDGRDKIAYHFSLNDGTAMALAGIYEISKEGVMQCCVMTTAANAAMAPVHDRMPVILAQSRLRDWLMSQDRAELDSLMAPCPPQWLRCDRVSSYVNDAHNEGVRCVEPA